MAGYSGTPLVKKLGIKENMKMYVNNPPVDYKNLVSPFPEGCQITSHLTSGYDFIHIFTKSKKELAFFLHRAKKSINSSGMIWVSWPKKSSKVPTDITEDTIPAICLPMDLVDIKVCAVDEVWSALKLVIRKEKRK